MDPRHRSRARGRPATRAVVAGLACLACLLLCYRVEILSGGRWMSGDLLDARIAVALEQHWLNVFQGLEAWDRPGYFYPAADTLGYNDGYFLYGVLFSGLRALHLDIFLANEATGAVFRAIGFFGLLAFGMRIGRLGFGWALLTASMALVSGNNYLQSAHIQLLTVGLAPWLALLAAGAVSGLADGALGRGIALSCAGAVLLDAWLMTALYPAWFTVFFGLLAVAAAFVASPAIVWGTMRRVRWGGLLPAAMVFAAGLAPFVAVYWPKAQETGMHSVDTVIGLTPAVLDLVHTGTGNLVFGWLDGLLTDWFRPGTPSFTEQTVGFAPVMFCLALAGAAFSFTRASAAQGFWWRPMAIAFVASLVLCVHVGDASLWRIVHAFVPGAGAIRVITRYLLMLDLVAALLACHVLAHAARHWRPVAIAAVAVLLLAEEVTTDGLYQLDRPAELAMLAAIPAPPPACKVIYLAEPRTVHAPDGSAYGLPAAVNVDAMLIAELVHRPTPNGHASFLPASFGLGYADTAQYRRTAPASILAQGLEQGVCGLDLPAARWVADPVHFPEAALDRPVSFAAGGGAGPYLLGGWSGAEPEGRWTDGPEASVGMQVGPASDGLALTIDAAAFAPGAVDAFVNGIPVAHWRTTAAPQTLYAFLPGGLVANGSVRIRLAIAHPVSPAALGLGADARALGLFVRQVRLSPASPRIGP